MRNFLTALLFAIGITACATSSAPAQVNDRPAVTESRYPVTCVTPRSFDDVTGHRDQVLYFEDEVGGQQLMVHVDTFTEDHEKVIVVYHTLINNGEREVCILHVTANHVQFPLEGITT